MYKAILLSASMLLLASPPGHAQDSGPGVNITAQLKQVEVTHNGKTVSIQRNQDKTHTIDPVYAKTSRGCPPFCIQPMHAAPGVETVGELEVLDYLERIHKGDKSVLVVDSRTPEWIARGTIPGSVNVPWSKINPNLAVPFESGESKELESVMSETFGAAKKPEGGWDFSQAKTLVLFCNGMWCPQSMTNIQTLLKKGYPADKLKWYRGGMQDWEILGLTTVMD